MAHTEERWPKRWAWRCPADDRSRCKTTGTSCPVNSSAPTRILGRNAMRWYAYCGLKKRRKNNVNQWSKRRMWQNNSECFAQKGKRFAWITINLKHENNLNYHIRPTIVILELRQAIRVVGDDEFLERWKNSQPSINQSINRPCTYRNCSRFRPDKQLSRFRVEGKGRRGSGHVLTNAWPVFSIVTSQPYPYRSTQKMTSKKHKKIRHQSTQINQSTKGV